MNRFIKVIDILLDQLKKVLVRFKKSKFGLLFIVNIFKIPDFMTDRRVSIISKFKVIFAFGVALLYMVSGVDFIPEMITGVFGLVDDLFIFIWCLGIINEELEKYKRIIKEENDPNIIKDVKFSVKDEKEQ
ncbi:YkvA family protein [Romboutsia lituseburensis]|uniref:YkvA family protein n=1 Tax=Romboutsia lituseburensis TaxID=1537 RepID=UPI00215A904C|nr:YkvA family protein [Romboutsia lituseburensis]MCR8745402.1 YkvA family protein [Romboutsia lituseburensis]